MQAVKWLNISQNMIGTSIAILLWHDLVNVTMNDSLHTKEKSYEIPE